MGRLHGVELQNRKWPSIQRAARRIETHGPDFEKLRDEGEEIVKAKDPEDAGPVKFAIVGGDEDHLFEIEETTGTIRVMKDLDRESVEKHVLVSSKCR